MYNEINFLSWTVQFFNQQYLQLTKQVRESCTNHDLTESMVVGPSALVQYEIDGAVGMYNRWGTSVQIFR
jgi:hypothetical protein